MKLINFNEYNSLKQELNEYVVLCNKYKYTPSKDEFDDMIRFILLLSGSGSSTLCESYEINPFPVINHLYESFGFDESNVIEGGFGQEPQTGEKDFDSATGLVIATGAAVTAGVAGAAIGIGKWIQYLFKKKKVKKACDAELQAELAKLGKGWNELAANKKKLAALSGETQSIDWPGMASGPAPEEKEK